MRFRASLWRPVGSRRVVVERGRRLVVNGCQDQFQFGWYIADRAPGTYAICIEAAQRLRDGRRSAHFACQVFRW